MGDPATAVRGDPRGRSHSRNANQRETGEWSHSVFIFFLLISVYVVSHPGHSVVVNVSVYLTVCLSNEQVGTFTGW